MVRKILHRKLKIEQNKFH